VDPTRRSRPGPAPGARGPGADARVCFIREHRLLRHLSARRLVLGSWARAAEAFLDRHVGGGPAELHVYLEARCAQACEFCAQPAQRDRPHVRALALVDARLDRLTGDLVASGAFEALLGACERRAPRVAVTVTGHDWARHPGRDALLGALERHPALPKRFLGPSTGLADPALARRVAAIPGLRAVALTLQAADPAAHDAMVGRPGAFAEVTAAAAALTAAGAFVEVNVVLTRGAVEHLARTLRWLDARGWKASLAAFAPEPALPAPDRLHPPLAQLRAALAASEVAAHAAVMSLVGVPLCAVPERLHRRVFAGAVAPAAAAPPPCARCPARGRCAGVSASYLRAHGDGDLAPLGG
jgi:hypothetical protein